MYLNKYVEFALLVCLFFHILILPLFEHPATFDVPFCVPIVVEFVLLAIYSARLVHAKLFQENHDFFGVKKNIGQIIVILVRWKNSRYFYQRLLFDLFFKITATDLIQYSIFQQFRISRPLRILFWINSSLGKELRRALRILFKTLPDIFNAYCLFFTTYFTFCFLEWQLFRKKYENFFYLKKFLFSNAVSYCINTNILWKHVIQ